MGRDRTFEQDRVIEAAADAFTAHGYQGTSLAMLSDVTGLGKQSLYNAFGDKRDLYRLAIDRAVERFASVQAAMQDASDGRAALQRFFDGLTSDCANADPARHGCIVSGGLLEDCPDELVRQHLMAKWQGTHELLRAAVERGQKDGSIVSPLASAALADLLMGLMSGLRVSAKARVGMARLAAIAALGLSVLDQPQGAPHED